MIIATQVDIDAPVARVWDVLTDFPGYATWNPFMVKLEGKPEAGAPITIDIRPPGGKPRRMREKVFSVTPQSELVWGAGIRGIGNGVHTFRLEELPGGRTRLHHGEVFTGVIFFFVKKLVAQIEAGFVLTNEALKRHVEATSRTSSTTRSG